MPEQKNYPQEIHIHGDVHIHLNNKLVRQEHEHRDVHVLDKTNRPKGIDRRLKNQYMKMILESMNQTKGLYLITWTYGKKCWGNHYDEVVQDIGQIRKRIIQLFYQNHRGWKEDRPTPDFPKQWFFIEDHKDGQFHIHLLMEPVDPDLMCRGFHNGRFQTYWERIVNQKITKRPHHDQRVITEEMVNRFPEYRNHPHYGKTFSQLNRYDGWLVARFICEFITHNNQRNGEGWGLRKLSNSPTCIHSKVLDTHDEVIQKTDYLNKDKNFRFKSNQALSQDHLCVFYSDLKQEL